MPEATPAARPLSGASEVRSRLHAPPSTLKKGAVAWTRVLSREKWCDERDTCRSTRRRAPAGRTRPQTERHAGRVKARELREDRLPLSLRPRPVQSGALRRSLPRRVPEREQRAGRVLGRALSCEDTHTGSYDYVAAPVHARTIVLHGVPDHPLAQIVRIPLANHRAGYHAHIILHGPWLDYVPAERNAPIPSRDLTKLARLAANRLNSGLDG